MARGGYGQGSGVPLHARRRGDQTAAEPTDDGCPARHVWVSDGADHAGRRRPGLLVEWRQRDGGWEGRVIYAAALRSTGWGTVEEWIPALLLDPL